MTAEANLAALDAAAEAAGLTGEQARQLDSLVLGFLAGMVDEATMRAAITAGLRSLVTEAAS